MQKLVFIAVLSLSLLFSGCSKTEIEVTDNPTLSQFIGEKPYQWFEDSLRVFADVDSNRVRNNEARTQIHFISQLAYDNARLFQLSDLSNDTNDMLEATWFNAPMQEAHRFYPYFELNQLDGHFFVAYEWGDSVFISNIVSLEQNKSTKSTGYVRLSDDNPEFPEFEWENDVEQVQAYFHVFANTDNALISGTVNRSSSFRFYDFREAEYEINPIYENPALISDQDYKFFIWAIDQNGLALWKEYIEF